MGSEMCIRDRLYNVWCNVWIDERQAGGVCRMRRVRTRYARAYSSPAMMERSKVKKKKTAET